MFESCRDRHSSGWKKPNKDGHFLNVRAPFRHRFRCPGADSGCSVQSVGIQGVTWSDVCSMQHGCNTTIASVHRPFRGSGHDGYGPAGTASRCSGRAPASPEPAIFLSVIPASGRISDNARPKAIGDIPLRIDGIDAALRIASLGSASGSHSGSAGERRSKQPIVTVSPFRLILPPASWFKRIRERLYLPPLLHAARASSRPIYASCRPRVTPAVPSSTSLQSVRHAGDELRRLL